MAYVSYHNIGLTAPSYATWCAIGPYPKPWHLHSSNVFFIIVTSLDITIFTCVFLDFAKAFDSVAHEHLLIKLQGIGINGELLQWIHSFLTHRLQRVVVSGTYSDWLSVRSGVPQGSVLGPLLFLLYIDDLHSIVRHSKLKLYADDVTLYREIKSEADCQLLQEDLDHICSWANK